MQRNEKIGRSPSPYDADRHILPLKGGVTMRNRMNQRQECRLTVGTLTDAMRAQSLLSASAIRSEIVGADGVRERREGCGYALTFSCLQEGQVRRILREAGLRRF